MVSPVPLIPQESRTLLFNQLAQSNFLKITQKQQSFRKEPKLKKHATRGHILQPFGGV
ncbi:hypothetical protein [Pseudalkalibacillus sp. R45]|uniref:hypothetical protein n=1 Tax=Pseudalkalibacillus sp. R45 TaxID=3457433 RepID=UPI003FCE2FEA